MPIPRYMVELLCHNVNYAVSASLCKTRRYTRRLLLFFFLLTIMPDSFVIHLFTFYC